MKYGNNMKLMEVNNQEFFKSIKDDCSHFFSGGNDAPLYRGLKTTRGKYEQLPIRKDRKPRDSSIVQTLLWNFYIEHKFGIKNARSKSVFASNSESAASSYGIVYYAFPINGTKVIFGDINDSASVVMDMLREFKKTMVSEIQTPPRLKIIGMIKHLNQLVSLTTSYENFVEVINREIKESFSIKDANNITQKALKAAFKIADSYEYQYVDVGSSQFKKALENKRSIEFLLLGTDYYYAIHSFVGEYDEILQKIGVT